MRVRCPQRAVRLHVPERPNPKAGVRAASLAPALYVGKSKDLRGRVKSYFYGDGRKKMEEMLSEVTSVDGVVCPGGELEALVVEARAISGHQPKYNRRGKGWRRYAYIKIDEREP